MRPCVRPLVLAQVLLVVCGGLSCSSAKDSDAARLALPAATSEAAGDGRRYDIVGLPAVTRATPKAALVLGADAAPHGGILIGLKNAEEHGRLRGATVAVDGPKAPTFVGGRVLDANNVPFPGATIALAADGRSLVVAGLDVPSEGWAHLWLDLAAPAPEGTRFDVVAAY